MNILLTGAFGNIGTHTLEELIRDEHSVTCFDMRTKANAKKARRYAGQARVLWGDLRRPEQVAAAVAGQDVVIHLAFVIPRLSVTGVGSEERPDWAREINVGGTRNLLAAMKGLPLPPKLMFSSSLHVFGRTQDQPAPRVVADPVQPIEHYSQHKVECEQLVMTSGLEWSILRLPATLPVRLILDLGMFDVPLNNRVEFAHGRDVGTAIANAVKCPDIWGKILLIGGGPRCQLYYRELVSKILDATGLGMLPESAFSHIPYPIDWLDTCESQNLLKYQQRTLDHYVQDIRALLRGRRWVIRMLRPVLRAWLLNHSPYYRGMQHGRI